MLIRDADLELSALPDAYEGKSMLVELFTGCGELGARLGTLEKRPAKHVLEAFYAGGHSRLSEVHLASGMDEAAGVGDDEEGTCEVDVHVLGGRLQLEKSIYRNFR
jgi:hypothetical protein